ncbi:MAG: mechanosensitive ion channel family protein [Gammaproteobacteria bacterium]|nr:mechanosensitive ion channel family protein [Gammaproteobacteria bacterium]MDH5592053.1 mechanosensitive ion channel family protein [Gammaproteobacteria bacterium]
MKMMMTMWLLVFSLLFCGTAIHAAPVITEVNAENAVIADTEIGQQVEVPESLSNPRETMRTFITAMQAVSEGQKEQIDLATSTLDLSDISELIRESRGRELARTLSSVIERSKKVVYSSIPREPKDNSYIFGKYSQGKVEITKLDDGRWLFSKQTVAVLPSVLEGLLEKPAKFGSKDPQMALPFHIKFRSWLPETFKGGILLEYWQWLGMFLIIVIGSIADKIVAWILSKNVIRWKQQHPAFKDLDNTVLRPLGLMAMALIWWAGLGLLGLPDTALVVLLVAVKLLVSLSGIWSAFRFVAIFDAFLTRQALTTDNKFDDLLVPMITKSLKVFVVVIGVVFAADNLNINVTSLLAGLGLGGLAFALAAKDLLGNFFGSLTVLLDRPFHIGDWVIIDNVEGSVEEVGFRSTRIRTFYNSLVTLPNSVLTNTKIDNMGARRYRRMKTMLALTYDTSPEKIEAFCEGVRALIQLHPYMRKDYYQVYFNEYGAASLDILVYVFWETPDWNTELRERHRFLLDILRLAKQLDVEFAYPTQTLYLRQHVDAGAPPTGFKPAMSEAQALAMGKKEAESIVDATLGRGVKPDPVRFP